MGGLFGIRSQISFLAHDVTFNPKPDQITFSSQKSISEVRHKVEVVDTRPFTNITGPLITCT